MKGTKVYIYGLCNVYYDSFYIQGIKEIFPEIEFNVSKFPDFDQGTFAFIIAKDGYETKIIIDSRDTNEIDFETFYWCDKYGKVNYNKELIPLEGQNKIIAIGPSFGIKIWNLFETTFFAIYHLIKFNAKIRNKREFIANYWRQYKRFPLGHYFPLNSKKNDVFFMSSIWKKENVTNNFRATFIKACIEDENLNFEGGFAPRKDGNNIGYDSLLYPKRILLKRYLSKTKNSAFVFNTPAVLSCHGWKLAEFLALGKAIISTPHKNSMPEPLEDNVHLVYVENIEDIEKRIKILVSDLVFKRKLEINSRDYFMRNLEPKVVINKLL
jgi:glycosyltransferase involved in cell wall biosynthesis